MQNAFAHINFELSTIDWQAIKKIKKILWFSNHLYFYESATVIENTNDEYVNERNFVLLKPDKDHRV